MWRSTTLIAVLAGCGRIGFDSGLGPFGSPVPLDTLNAPGADQDPNLSADGLELVFASDRPGSMGATDIWVARRASLDGPWGAPVHVPELSSTFSDQCPELSEDSLTILLSSSRAQMGGMDVFVATRASRTSPWTTPSRVAELSSAGADYNAFLLSDELEVYLASNRTGSEHYDLYKATRADRGGPWSSPIRVDELNSPQADGDMWLDPTGTTILFDSARTSGSDDDLYIATRPDASSPWGTPKLIEDLHTTFEEQDPTMSADLRMLIFTSDRDGNLELYMVTR